MKKPLKIERKKKETSKIERKVKDLPQIYSLFFA